MLIFYELVTYIALLVSYIIFYILKIKLVDLYDF
jgi:hypothetical protein